MNGSQEEQKEKQSNQLLDKMFSSNLENRENYTELTDAEKEKIYFAVDMV